MSNSPKVTAEQKERIIALLFLKNYEIKTKEKLIPMPPGMLIQAKEKSIKKGRALFLPVLLLFPFTFIMVGEFDINPAFMAPLGIIVLFLYRLSMKELITTMTVDEMLSKSKEN